MEHDRVVPSSCGKQASNPPHPSTHPTYPPRIRSAIAPRPQGAQEDAPSGSAAPSLHTHMGRGKRSTRILLRICNAIAPHRAGSAPRGSPSGSAAPSLHAHRGAQEARFFLPAIRSPARSDEKMQILVEIIIMSLQNFHEVQRSRFFSPQSGPRPDPTKKCLS